MGRRRKSPAKTPKNRQVHFWVDDDLTGHFDRVAESLGEQLTDAHRTAMRQYIDQNCLEGAHFILESQLTLGRQKMTARVFATRPRELVIRLSGAAVESIIDLADRVGPRGDLGTLVERLLRNGQESTPAGRR